MTDQSQNTPHPLEIAEEDEDASSSHPPWSSGFKHPKLLKFSLYSVATSGVILFLASVTAGNATYQSTMQQMAEAVYRIAMLAMLLAFGLILVAYRLPRLPESGSIWLSLKQMLVWSPGKALVIFNLLGVGVVWLVTLMGNFLFNTWLSIAFVPLLVLLPALWTTMIVVHRGFLQVYAIAALTSSLLIPILLSVLGWRMLGYPSGRLAGEMGFAIYTTLVIVNGLLCSGYAFMHAKSSAGDRPPSDSNSPGMLD